MDTVHKESVEPCWAAEGIFSDCVIKQGKEIVYLFSRWETWFPPGLLKDPGGEGAYIIYIRQNMNSGQARTPSLPAPGGKKMKVHGRFQSLSGGERYGDRSAGERARRRCAVDGGENRKARANHRKLWGAKPWGLRHFKRVPV